MTHPSPDKVYANLTKMEQSTVVQGADYRQAAIATIADHEVNLSMRQAIADRLEEANLLLTLKNVDAEDSY